MQNSRVSFVTVFIAVLMLIVHTKSLPVFAPRQTAEPVADGQSAILDAFAEVKPIDAHVHVFKDDPAFIDFMKRLKLSILDICVIDDRDPFFKGLSKNLGSE